MLGLLNPARFSGRVFFYPTSNLKNSPSSYCCDPNHQPALPLAVAALLDFLPGFEKL